MRRNSMHLTGVPEGKGNIHRDDGQEFFILGKIHASDDLQIEVSSRKNKTKFTSRITAIKSEIYTHAHTHTHNNVYLYIHLIAHPFCANDVAWI